MNNTNSASERTLIWRLNRRLEGGNQAISVSHSGKPARYLLIDRHSGNPEAWTDSLERWAREMGVQP